MNQVHFTDRIILKQLDEKHTDIILDYFIRNKEFLNEWEALRADEFYTFETQYSLLKRIMSHLEMGLRLNYGFSKSMIKTKLLDASLFKTLSVV